METTLNLLDRYRKVMVPNYAPLNLLPIKGEGSWVTDVEGRRLLDLTGGIAVTGLGHCPPEVTEALKEQADKIWHVSNYFASLPQIELAELFTGLTGFDRVFFGNSGSEAVEAALKLARRYAFDHHGEKKNQIVSFHKSFHGRSLFTVTAGGQESYRKGFGPLPPQMIYGNFNQIDELEGLINEETCAVIMEPIMAEGGVYPATAEFAQAVREACDKHQALLIFDEVQSGAGRTGTLYAFEQLGVRPDILTSAKALGSGFPIGAMLTRDRVAQSFQPGTHGSTFGGNPLACAAAKATLEQIAKPELLANVKLRSEQLNKGLQRLGEKYQLFEEIRGLGLLIGCELKAPYKGKAKAFVEAALEKELMILVAGADVLRFVPSLRLSEEELAEGLKRLEAAIQLTLTNL
ncbi:MAG: acetylornithine/succinyldiaminopimelate transaminase [bacterium]|nr:acetylornithine/succinyldiaminopimelate transaminase [bacterium]